MYISFQNKENCVVLKGIIIARHHTPTWWMACDFSHVYSLWISWQGVRLSHALVFHMPKPQIHQKQHMFFRKTVLDIFGSGIFLCDHHWKFWNKLWNNFSEKGKPFLQKWKWNFTLGAVLWGQELVHYLGKPGWLLEWWWNHTS